MNITDEMVTAAAVALYRSSGDLEPTNDEMRAALSAALAVQPAEPVATVIKRGADRTWMSERLGGLPDGSYSLYLAPQPVALPPLPVGAADTFVRFPDDGDRHQYRLSDLLAAYARAALAAAGVTVDEGGDRG